MGNKTTKAAVTANTTKSVKAIGAKETRRTGAVRGMDNERAPRAEPGARKRRKPFVL